MPPLKRTVPMTPTLQSLADQINVNMPASVGGQVTEPEEPDYGVLGIGKIFRAASNAAADTVEAGVKGLGYLGKALAWSSENITKPMLGAAVAYTVYEGYDPKTGRRLGFDIGKFRQTWEEWKPTGTGADGVLKFGAEMAADPLLWVGIGAWKTPTLKFAEILTREAATGLAVAEKAGAGARIARIVADPVEGLGRALSVASKEYAFSPEARAALNRIGKGVQLTDQEIGGLVGESIKQGLIPSGRGVWAAEFLKDSRYLSKIRPGWMARLVNPTRLQRVLGPIDVFADAVWAVPFRAAAPLLSPFKGPAGKLSVAAIDAIGNAMPIKQFTWLASRLGPPGMHDAYQAAKNGVLGTWAFRQAPEALELEAARVSQQVRHGMSEAASQSGVSPLDVLGEIRNGNKELLDRLPIGNDALDALTGAFHPDALPDSEFMKVLKISNNPSEDEVLGSVTRHVSRWYQKTMGGAPLFEAVEPELTAFNRFWGWTQGLVGTWRKWVTSRNPSFVPLQLDNISRGGGGLVVGNAKATVDLMVAHGLPSDLALGASDSMLEITLNKLGKRLHMDAKVGEVAGQLEHDIGVPVKDLIEQGLINEEMTVRQAEKVLSKYSLTQLGVSDVSDNRVFAAMHSLVLKADHSAIVNVAHNETTDAFLQKILTAEIDTPEFRLRKLLEEWGGRGELNPALVSELQKAIPNLTLRPAEALTELTKNLGYDNILSSQVKANPAWSSMPEEWQAVWESHVQQSIDNGLPVVEALQRATEVADRRIPFHQGYRMGQESRQIVHFEKVLDGALEGAGLTGNAAVRTQMKKLQRETLQGVIGAVSTFDEPWAKAAVKSRLREVPFALRQTDMVTYSAVSEAAASRGFNGMQLIPMMEAQNQKITKRIATSLHDIAQELPKYRKAMMAGKADVARKSLRKMSGLHGDFSAFAAADELPLPEMIEEQFKLTGDNIWSHYVGSRYSLADGLIAVMDNGALDTQSITTLFNATENEIFQMGNIPEVRRKTADMIARLSGNTGQVIPGRTARVVLNAAERQSNTRLAKDFFQDQWEARLGQYDEATEAFRETFVKDMAVEEQRLGRPAAEWAEEEVQAFANRTVKLQQVTLPKPVEQFYLDLQNNYPMLGRRILQSASKIMPGEYRKVMLENSATVKRVITELAANEDSDRAGLQLLHKMANEVVDISRDKVMKLRVSNLYRDAIQERGLPVARQRLVDYTQRTNFHKLASSVLPFASFQLHLPGYLARTFMERPGVIAFMNHFAQEADENLGPAGGLMFGGGFVFAPQLRFSYLPIMAGNNFVNGNDHPLNQMNAAFQLFGFSPGPNIQITADLMNRFADQAGVTKALGLPEGAPEFKGGLLPQWRFLQDVTAVMGIDGGKGLSVPFLGPSTDMREREVRRILVGRVAGKVEQFRKQNGRDPYPTEVTDIRESVWQTDIKSARQEAALRDIPAFFTPGLRVHDPDYTNARDRAAMWMTAHGLEGVNGRNVVSKYKNLNQLQKANLLQLVPEFQDVLGIPPWEESGAQKKVRTTREKFFRARDVIMSNTAREQRRFDSALEQGNIGPVEYRGLRSDLRIRMAGSLDSLENNPDYKPFLARERNVPTEPAELAYMDYQKLEPQDANGNGVVDEDDMQLFFEVKRQYLNQQPEWVRDYIRTRQEFQMTPMEIEFTRAQAILGQFFEIPKYLGLTKGQGDEADKIIKISRTLAQALPGKTSLTEVIMKGLPPEVAPESRLLALTALRAGRNPDRWAFWMGNRELEAFYPDLRPALPSEGS